MLLALSSDSASISPEVVAPVSVMARYENFGMVTSFKVQGSRVLLVELVQSVQLVCFNQYNE
jgi:hypothetical protein